MIERFVVADAVCLRDVLSWFMTNREGWKRWRVGAHPLPDEKTYDMPPGNVFHRALYTIAFNAQDLFQQTLHYSSIIKQVECAMAWDIRFITRQILIRARLWSSTHTLDRLVVDEVMMHAIPLAVDAAEEYNPFYNESHTESERLTLLNGVNTTLEVNYGWKLLVDETRDEEEEHLIWPPFVDQLPHELSCWLVCATLSPPPQKKKAPRPVLTRVSTIADILSCSSEET